MSAGRIPFGIKITLGLVLFFGMFWIAMTFGAADTTTREVWNALTFGPLNEKAKIVQEIRLPRELAAILVGAALGVSGAIMQAMTRNPLADPGLLGLTAGANAHLRSSSSCSRKLTTSDHDRVFRRSSTRGSTCLWNRRFEKRRLLTAPDRPCWFRDLSVSVRDCGRHRDLLQDCPRCLTMDVRGLVGSTWGQLQVIAPVIAIGIVIAFIFSRQLTILSLSEEVALGLGQNIQRIKAVLYVVVILLAGAAVALVGNMAFIGLMIPHIVRAIVGTDYRFILPMTAIFGATFMLLADTIGRTLYAPYETPVIAIVSMLGLPFFLLIVRKGGRAFS